MPYLYESCGDYSVTPMLMAPEDLKCCEPQTCVPCLPSCNKGRMVYCCDRPKKKCQPDKCCYGNEFRKERPQLTCRPSSQPCSQESCCRNCNRPACIPVKTKYVMPCYRYEDGRIENQPTCLMRRACEVAVGVRPRRRPFVESCYRADSDQEVHKYSSEDEQGNYCYHYEKKNNDVCTNPCHSCPRYGDHVHAQMVDAPGKCFFYCS